MTPSLPPRAFPAFALAWLVLALGLVAAPSARAADAAQTFVQSLSDKATAILQDKSLNADGRDQAFRVLILNNTDLDKIADFALGRYGQQMRDNGRYDEYKKLFRDYVVRIYAARLSTGQDQSLRITKSVPRGDTEVVVLSLLDPPKGSAGNPLEVNWRLLKEADTFKIKDVQIAGAWMALEQQSQFQTIIANNNRDPATLIDYLQKQLKAPVPPAPDKQKG